MNYSDGGVLSDVGLRQEQVSHIQILPSVEGKMALSSDCIHQVIQPGNKE